jgi:hypothetical protein
LKPGQIWIAKDIGPLKQLYPADVGERCKILFVRKRAKELGAYFTNLDTNETCYIIFVNNQDFYNHFKLERKYEKRNKK